MASFKTCNTRLPFFVFTLALRLSWSPQLEASLTVENPKPLVQSAAKGSPSPCSGGLRIESQMEGNMKRWWRGGGVVHRYFVLCEPCIIYSPPHAQHL